MEVRLADESVWLNADQMAELLQRNKSTISRYIKNIRDSGGLQRNSVVAENATTMTAQIRRMTSWVDCMERTRCQLSPVEIHFIEKFEAEQKRIRKK